MRAIVLLEGSPTHGPPLHDLLRLPEPEEPTAVNPARVRSQTPPQPQPVVNTEFENPSHEAEDLVSTIVVSEVETRNDEDDSLEYMTPDQGETWYCRIDDSEDNDTAWYPVLAYPVDRATRPATKEELKSRHAEFTEARKKELKSWIENKTGSARKRCLLYTSDAADE